jgi:D-glycero-alpha-D-manno-heptose-7-phosphate kinase
MADIPAGTGLGSSGAFAVGVLNALHAHLRLPVTNERLAELACALEIDRLREPVGKQDQYATAIGGVTAFRYNTDDSVDILRVAMSDETRSRFEENLLLFYTGVRRSASDEIRDQLTGATRTGETVEENLARVRHLGHESHEALEAGDLHGFARLMTEQWRAKLRRSPSDLHHQVDGWIEKGIAAGAAGGKLVGAGGGGFLLFYAESKADLRMAMAALGLVEVRFAFDDDGTKIVGR